MRVLCDVCERAEATLVCCADEALLCSSCDKQIHEANKLAGKHHRVPLANHSGAPPHCDVCQEKPAYFCCIQDRALLCRGCDASLHLSSAPSGQHQRFLITGARVSSSIPVPAPEHRKAPESFPATTLDAGSPSWLLDDIAGCYHLKDPSPGSSKAGDLEWSPELNIFNDAAGDEGPQEVPQTPSPPTASGLSRSKRVNGAARKPSKPRASMLDWEDYLVVPDILSEPTSPLRKRKHMEIIDMD